MSVTYPCYLTDGDTFRLTITDASGGSQEYVYTATKATKIMSETHARAICKAYPVHFKPGDSMGVIDGRNHVAGEEVAFATERQMRQWIEAAEGIPEIGLVSPRD